MEDECRLDGIAEPTVLVAADTLCEEIEALFLSRRDLGSIVVHHPDGDLEMLTRRRFALEYTGPIGYGRALYARRPVATLPGGGRTLLLDGGTSLLQSGEAALARKGRDRYDDIVVPNARGAATVSLATLFSELALLHAHRSLHDPLTGLANRDLFLRRVEAMAADPQAAAAVLFVDLDDFKAVNDSLGHPAGDALLRVVAGRLREAFHAQDTVARLGGDEFAVLLLGEGARDPIGAADRIAQSLATPAVVGSRAVTVRASIGIARRAAGATAADLLRDADLAMYTAKHGGKNGHAVFEPAMHRQAVERLDLAHDLDRALPAGELELVFQPVVELTTGATTGAEALLRWTHPLRGPVGPLEFIPLAEKSGSIVEIGRWVLYEALREVAAWNADRPDRPLTIGVNVSTRQLASLGFAADVRTALAQAGVAPTSLILEVTETAVITDDEVTHQQLFDLAALGVTIAIDDFGTGFSSLHRLQRLPVGMLKIDKAFVDDLSMPGRSGLVRGLLGLADALGIGAVAEGIEDELQRAELVAAGCRLGQGFHLARPLAPSAFAEHLAHEMMTTTA